MDNETESSRISIAFICASGRLRSRYFRLSGQGDPRGGTGGGGLFRHPCQLSEMQCTSETATGQSAKAGTVTANGSKPLDAYQQPMRVVIHGGSSGNWVRMVTKIEFVPLESGQ